MVHVCAREASIVEPRSDQNGKHGLLRRAQTVCSVRPCLAAYTGAAPQFSPSIKLPHQSAHKVSCRVAIDIGGSLAKLVFFVPSTADGSTAAHVDGSSPAGSLQTGGTLQFAKFETARMDEVLSFIESDGLLRPTGSSDGGGSDGSVTGHGPAAADSQRDGRSGHASHSLACILATGGGAFKFATQFQERLGVTFEKGDEMDCLVRGCNFLQTSVPREAFTFRNGTPTYLDKANGDVFPYLLVNIGSGVSIVKVSSATHAERVSGSALGGGTFAGLCRLLTGVKSFDEMLRLAAQGDNKKVDMLVGDIYGNRDYSKIKLSAETIASSFGKVVSGNLDLQDCSSADIALSLCRMVSYNVAQIAYEVATSHGLHRVLFGGFFIRANGFTMETITFALDFWSKGRMAATFLRHEGFLGAIGAFVGSEAEES